MSDIEKVRARHADIDQDALPGVERPLEQLLFDALDEHRPGMAGGCVDSTGAAVCPWTSRRGDNAAPFTVQHRDHLARDVIAPLVLEFAATTEESR